MKKEMNYTIEFYRFMLAINFCLVHSLMVFPMFVFGSQVPFFYAGLDVIVPFMAFSGYFMMGEFLKKEEGAKLMGKTPGRQAWEYLKSRLIGLGPTYLVASLAGWLMINIWNNNRIIDWPIHLLNAIWEFFGLQITGAGFGNPSVGTDWYPTEGAWPPVQMLGSPLWFISGIFVAGTMIYFLLAYNKKLFIGFIAPVSTLLFYGSHYLGQEQPMWYQITDLGGFHVAQGWPEMFVGLSLGCLCYVAVDNLKGKKFSGGMIGFLTVVQIVMTIIVWVRSWVPIFIPFGQYFNLGWASVHLMTLIFTFLVVLNVDKCTRFKLFSSKIWATPGRMAVYFYMLHWPMLYIVAMCLGMKGLDLSYITMDNMMETMIPVYPKFIMLFAITTVVSLVVAYFFMKFDKKKIQPWLKSRPWYTREQAAIEDANAEAEKEEMILRLEKQHIADTRAAVAEAATDVAVAVRDDFRDQVSDVIEAVKAEAEEEAAKAEAADANAPADAEEPAPADTPEE